MSGLDWMERIGQLALGAGACLFLVGVLVLGAVATGFIPPSEEAGWRFGAGFGGAALSWLAAMVLLVVVGETRAEIECKSKEADS